MLRLVLGIACALSLILSGVAGAQDYPTRPIRLIVGYGAGGATDLAARIVADHMDILGPLTEKALRQALSMSGGGLAILTRSYLATGLLAASALVLLSPLWSELRRRVSPRR